MSSIKKVALIMGIITLLVVMTLMTACGGGAKTETTTAKASDAAETTEVKASESAETTVAVESAAAGETYEIDKFSILVPTGWKKMDIPGGVQIYKGSDIMQVSVSGSNVTEAEDKALLEGMSKQYSGTALEEVSMFGMKFFKTSFTANGSDQTMYSGVRNGEQVKIQMAGKDHQNNEAIKSMFSSIKLK